jgi:Competence protein CoiA-like family
MLYAKVAGEKLSASPGQRANCPHCGAQVIAKCGSINIWHWAHQTDCACEHEPETEWHLTWKARFPKDCVEVAIGANRADVYLGAFAVEFQHSPISPEQIQERQNAYGHVIWVFDCAKRHIELRPKQIGTRISESGYDKALRWAQETDLDDPEAYAENADWEDEQEPIYEDPAKSNYRTFRWKWPQRSLEAIDLEAHRLFFDFGSQLFQVKKIYWNDRVAGWGYLYQHQTFLNQLFQRQPATQAAASLSA